MRWLTAAIRVCLGVTAFCQLTRVVSGKDCAMESSGVYLTISSHAEFYEDTGYLRWVEAHWFGMTDFQAGDLIGVWREDPSTSNETLIEQHEVLTSDGMVVIQERWNGSLVPSVVGSLEDSCLPYWAGYVRDGVVLQSSCLMVRPHWMAGMKAELSAMKISETALPGVHDAGASGHFATIVGSLVGRWTFTQDENFWQQLVFGARYMDVRIAYYPSTEEKLFINHGEIRIAPLQLYIDNVVEFMSQTEEIVIFDIHELSVGFNGYPERHEELISVLEENFHLWMVPKSLSPNPTLGELWDSGTRLIVTYPSSEGSASPYLWNAVHHLWGNVDNLEDLKSYMDNGIPEQSGRGSLWSAMTEFTPSALDVAMDRWGGLRGAAAITNPPVTGWLRNDWWDMVNIVSMDFFLSSDVVSVAIEANKKRLECSSRRKKLMTAEHLWLSTNSAAKGSLVKSAEPSEPRIWLWVSALTSTAPDGQVTQRQFEINWDVVDIQEGDWVGLYNHDPTSYWSDPVEQTIPEGGTTHYLTSESLPYLPVNTSMEEGTCLGWWAAYLRNDAPIAVNCIKIHPRWMSVMQVLIQEVPIRNIVIPGVHDAGTYTAYSAYAENPIMKYAITQDESIYNLLVYGNRYIDLRVGYFEADPDEPYWVVHGITVWRPFREVLREVRSFVETTTDAAIIEIGGFTFFTSSEHHDGCITLVMEELGDVMAPNTNNWDTLVGDLLGSVTNLIVIYDHEESVAGNKLFWPSFEGKWANAQSIEQLEIYMVDVIEGSGGPPNPPWSLSGQLTPLAEDVILDTLGGLRAMADMVNRNVTQWFLDRWWDKISVISCDFVLSAGYVEITIEINHRRFE